MYAITTIDRDEYGNEAIAYWTTRCGETDNYTYDVWDATRFATISAARAIIKTLELDNDHGITAV